MSDRRTLWMRVALVVIAVTWTVLAAVVQCWVPQRAHRTVHPNHPLATAVGAEFAVNVDHAHLSDNAMRPCPLDFATLVAPQANSPVFAADAVATAGGVRSVHARLVVPAGRGPPGSLGSPPADDDLLTRMCLARR